MRRRRRLLPQVPNPKNQIPRKIQNPNNKRNVQNPPRRDLEDRTFQFAQAVRSFVKTLPRNISNAEDVRQLVRASGSVAANWIGRERDRFLQGQLGSFKFATAKINYAKIRE